MNISWDLVSAIAAAISVGAAIFIFVHDRRHRRFEFLEQSFDVLQRLNEKALERDENIQAALLSLNPNDQTTVEEGRIIYFHFMRINRAFRAYEYMRGGYISEVDADRIIAPYLGSFKPMLDKMPAILARGYPSDFRDYLIARIEKAELLPEITSSADGKGEAAAPESHSAPKDPSAKPL